MGLGEVLGAGHVEPRRNGGCWAQGVCRGQNSNRGVRERSGGDFGGVYAGADTPAGAGTPRREREKKKDESKNGVASAADYATQRSCRSRRRRRFQTSKLWLLFLAFSTYLTRNASPGPTLAIIQIVNLRASSHASQQQRPTRDLIIDTRRKCRSWLRRNPPDDFFPEACTKRCNEYSIFKPGLVTNKRMRVMNTPYAVLQASIMPH
jgi:hypothetical protein